MNTSGLYNFDEKPTAETLAWLESDSTAWVLWGMLDGLAILAEDAMSLGNAEQKAAPTDRERKRGDFMTRHGENYWNQAYGLYRALMVVAKDAPDNVYDDLVKVGNTWFWALMA